MWDVLGREGIYIRTSIVGFRTQELPFPVPVTTAAAAWDKSKGSGVGGHKQGRRGQALSLSQNGIRLFISVLCSPS